MSKSSKSKAKAKTQVIGEVVSADQTITNHNDEIEPVTDYSDVVEPVAYSAATVSKDELAIGADFSEDDIRAAKKKHSCGRHTAVKRLLQG